MRINYFLNKHKISDNRFCLFDFYGNNTIYLSVFEQGKCLLLREIRYESLDEARLEIIQSLRLASAKSSVKQFDKFYLSGNLTDKDNLINQLEKVFNAKIEHRDLIIEDKPLSDQEKYFNLNLVRNYSYSLSQRKKILKAAHVAISICIVLFMLFHIKLFIGAFKLRSINRSYSESDYNLALDLHNQLKDHNNAK